MDNSIIEKNHELKIGIIGLGLIGGSVAKALKDRSGVTVRVAVDKDEVSLLRALDEGYILEHSDEIGAVSECDIVFVCVPVGAAMTVLQKLSEFYKGIVTDTASTKGSIS